MNSDEIVERLGYPYGESQGDATLAGAVYGVYRYDELVDAYTTDKNGYILTDYYVCGDGWNIREISPSEGYLLDESIYWLDVDASQYTVEKNTVEQDVYENIIYGGLYLFKHKDTGTEKLTWTYRPMLSFTGHSFRSFLFDLEYTHIEATCTGGELWNLEAEGQPHDTNMRFEKGKTVYWTPAEEDEDPADKAEVTLTVYNGDTKMQQHTVIFECVSRDYSEGDVYEFYLKDTTKYALVYSEDGYLTFVERSLISNVGGVDGPSSVIIGADESQYSTVIDTANFDIDGDGKEEQCALSAGPTSGLFTFIFSVSENGNLEYFNIFNSPYTELKFKKNAEGKMLLVGKSGEKTCYIGMDISDGNIVLSSDEQEVSYWGEQGLNSPYAPKAASDLNNAIAKVLNEKYQSEKPDGLLHIENYYLLAHQTASGTPLKGNTGHMKIANVYLLVYHIKYSVNGGQLEEHEGDFVPTAITFSIDENGGYTLEDYWTPQTGSNYENDVRSKFPGDAAENALNTEKYAEDLIKESWRLATEYFNQTKSSSN